MIPLSVDVSEDHIKNASARYCPVTIAIATMLRVPKNFVRINALGICNINNVLYKLCDNGRDLVDDWDCERILSPSVIQLIPL